MSIIYPSICLSIYSTLHIHIYICLCSYFHSYIPILLMIMVQIKALGSNPVGSPCLGAPSGRGSGRPSSPAALCLTAGYAMLFTYRYHIYIYTYCIHICVYSGVSKNQGLCLGVLKMRIIGCWGTFGGPLFMETPKACVYIYIYT